MSKFNVAFIVMAIVAVVIFLTVFIWRALTKEKREFLTYLCLMATHRASFIDQEKEFTVEVKSCYYNRELSVYSILINDRIVGMYRVDWQFRIHKYAYFINYEYDTQEVLKLLKIAYRRYCIENEHRGSYRKSLYK